MSAGKSFLRNIIGEYMSTLGSLDSKVVVVNADLAGTCRNTGFVQQFPDRSFNVGIAEQNMASFAAGLACEGFKPYIFSMAPFLSMRACEQCRTDIAYGARNVKMIGVYAGVSGGISGATHWALEDCGIMTSIPGIAVYEVSDANLTKKLLDLSLTDDHPMYIRCSVEPTRDIYPQNIELHSGGSITCRAGDDGAFLCAGVTVQYALDAAEQLNEQYGVSIRVVDMYSIKPVDEDAIISAAATGNIVVVHDHNVYGGLGSIVAPVIVESGLSTKFKILGIDDTYHTMAHAGYLYHKLGMDCDGLKTTMENMLGLSLKSM